MLLPAVLLQVLAGVSMQRLPVLVLLSDLDLWSGGRGGRWRCVVSCCVCIGRLNVVKKTSQGVIECGDPDSEQDLDPEAAAKDAIRDYDPEQDPRLWRAVAGMWRSVCVEFADIAAGYASDGRPASEIAARLQRELQDRIAQENSSFAEFKQQFRRTAAEWLERQKSNRLTDDMRQQMMELDRERQAAAARAAEQDRQNRERQAAELEARAAALRSGPQSRTTSYLAR